jgi:sugar phosphate isomerase/epimerase
MQSSIKFAVFTGSLPEYTPEDAVALLREIGYDGVEWRVVDQEPSPNGQPGFWKGNRCTIPLQTFVEDASRIRATTEQAGLEIAGVGSYPLCHQLTEVEQVLRGAALLGAPMARIRLPKYDGREHIRVMRERARAQFRDVEGLAKRYGVRAVIQMHHETITPSASALASFLDGFDPRHVGAMWDPGNMVKEGYEQYQLGLETLGEYLATVHVKNVDWHTVGTHTDGTVTWQSNWAPLKKGVADIGAVFKALEAVEYRGWVTFEDFTSEQPRPERLRNDLAYVKHLAGTDQLPFQVKDRCLEQRTGAT